jgi:hypothetical protein
MPAMPRRFRLRARWAYPQVRCVGGPRGARTHNPRIKRPHDRGHCGPYQRLCPHRVPHQPHQQTMVNGISCHEPCHAAPDRRGSSLLDAAPGASRTAHESGQRFRNGDGLGLGLAAVSSDHGDLLALLLAPEPWKSMNPSPSVPAGSTTIWCPIHHGREGS